VKLINVEELVGNKQTYLFQLLPGFNYAEVDDFTVNGRQFKVLLSAPAKGSPLGKIPAYAVIMKFVMEQPEPHEGWAISPWVSTPILERLAKLPKPEESAVELNNLLASLPQAAPEVPGQGQPAT